MKVVITLGPTQEPIDDVRFITNASSGRMGATLAEEGLRRGHDVTLVCGPVHVLLPKNARVVNVRTAKEMIGKTLDILEDADSLISTAAIADYSPEKVSGKIKSGGELVLKLKPTRKLISEARKRFPKLFIVGFKAEYGIGNSRLIESAGKSLTENKLDIVVANDLSNRIVDSEDTEAVMIDGERTEPIGRTSKKKAAKRIWDRIEAKLKV